MLAGDWTVNRVPGAELEPHDNESTKQLPLTVVLTALTVTWLVLTPPFRTTEVEPPEVGPSVTLPEAVSAPEIVAEAQESAEAVAVIAPATTVRPALNVASAETASVLAKDTAPLALHVPRMLRMLLGTAQTPFVDGPTTRDRAAA